MLEPFRGAVKTVEGNYLALAQAPHIMATLDAHIETEASAFDEGPIAAAGETMLLDHADHCWDELLEVMKMAAELNARTKGLHRIQIQRKERSSGGRSYWPI